MTGLDPRRPRAELERIRDDIALERTRVRLRIADYEAAIQDCRAKTERLRQRLEVHTFDLGILEAKLGRLDR